MAVVKKTSILSKPDDHMTRPKSTNIKATVCPLGSLSTDGNINMTRLQRKKVVADGAPKSSSLATCAISAVSAVVSAVIAVASAARAVRAAIRAE
ncbi:hypothetical protein LTR27_011787 [Elasticomyces elasticus]|nr:hypothetical protein LTR27_011787 [Elasticomyces elasticus]